MLATVTGEKLPDKNPPVKSLPVKSPPVKSQVRLVQVLDRRLFREFFHLEPLQRISEEKPTRIQGECKIVETICSDTPELYFSIIHFILCQFAHFYINVQMCQITRIAMTSCCFWIKKNPCIAAIHSRTFWIGQQRRSCLRGRAGPLNPSFPFFGDVGGLSGENTVPMMMRSASLSGNCTPDRLYA